METRTNALIDETSPYLLQHAHNPVDWQPWNETAISHARERDVPILLSIGYAACHWCHVMEHESFEDPAIAEVMNRHFVCIKVDREERPDLDKIHQVAHQILTGRPGGWPLNIFLTPDDHTPFFSGTYFPPVARYGMPPFAEVLEKIAHYYRHHRADIRRQNDSLRETFERIASSKQHPVRQRLDATPLERAAEQLAQAFDPIHGGFGGAPKFPHPTNLERGLRHGCFGMITATSVQLAEAALHSLVKMAEGGLQDQVGGGFYRYSVDDQWMIPHFEKMLYDNAQLIPLYLDAGLQHDRPDLLAVARRTCDWALAEMQDAGGGFYSSLDADSEGEEGRFYTWDRDEVEHLLEPQQWSLFRLRYGFDRAANFEGRWHLHAVRPIDEVATMSGIDRRQADVLLRQALGTLHRARDGRQRPGLDDKVLTAWNALMIRALARAGRLLDAPRYTSAADRALQFIRNALWDGARLLATSRAGRHRLNAYLDDYALLADALLELLQTRWSDSDAAMLMTLLDGMLGHFEDRAHGGFFFTSDDHERLLTRIKPDSDDALPSGNGIAAQVLIRAGHLFGEPRYLDAAERTLQCLWRNLQHSPSAHGALLSALEEYLTPPELVILRGESTTMCDWQGALAARSLPGRLVFAIPNSASPPAGLAAKVAAPAGVVAYHCTGPQCRPPVSDLDALLAQLDRD